MEGLQLKIESLQWEMSRLDAENKKLRALDPEKAEQVDTEMENLEQRTADADERAAKAKSRAAEAERLTMEAEQKATEAQTRAAEAERQLVDAQQMTDELRRETQKLRDTCASLEERCETEHGEKGESERLCGQLREKVSEIACLRESLEGLEQRYLAENEALVREFTLDRYKALDAEREKWEARELRLVEQLEAVKRDHQISSSSDDTHQLQTQLKEAQKQQNSLIVQLSEAKMKNSQVEDVRRAQDQRIGELNAEILVLKTQICSAKLPSSSSPASLSSPFVSPYAPASRASVSRIESKSPASTAPSTSTAPIMTTVESATTGRPVSTHVRMSTTTTDIPTTSLSASASTLASVPSLPSVTSTVGASAATAPITLLPTQHRCFLSCRRYLVSKETRQMMAKLSRIGWNSSSR